MLGAKQAATLAIFMCICFYASTTAREGNEYNEVNGMI